MLMAEPPCLRDSGRRVRTRRGGPGGATRPGERQGGRPIAAVSRSLPPAARFSAGARLYRPRMIIRCAKPPHRVDQAFMPTPRGRRPPPLLGGRSGLTCYVFSEDDDDRAEFGLCW